MTQFETYEDLRIENTALQNELRIVSLRLLEQDKLIAKLRAELARLHPLADGYVGLLAEMQSLETEWTEIDDILRSEG